ncbi:MAG TPA: TonB-dependent receptor [Opitutaceae bacterium]
MSASARRLPFLVALVSTLVLPARAQSSSPAVQLAPIAVLSDRVANQQATGTFTMPVTLLRFEPGVDVQERNLAEGQADIAIRGGTFENTGFKVGGLSLYDPQTGHYSAEIPLAPAMLTAPIVITGAGHARAGWNATAGTVAYTWAPVRAGGELEVGAGEHRLFRASLQAGQVGNAFGGQLGVDVSAGYSESAGAIANGDHQFSRATARLQFSKDGAQTDWVAGRQGKFFGWVNLYTPFNSPESEDLETTLLAFNHRRPQGADGGYLQVSAYHRENYDDYRFNRFAPVGPVLPFEHTTWVYGAGLDGRWASSGAWSVDYRAGVVTDEIKSTSLTFGSFRSRTHLSAGVFPEWRRVTGDAAWSVATGVTVDDTNRDDAKVSPVLEIARERAGSPLRRLHVGYAQTTQVPGYTALNAAPGAGLFRGNPNLGRSTSRNLEAGARFAFAGWEGSAAVFHRRDDQLVDWTFRRGVTARSANAVDIDSTGIETVARRSFGRTELVLGYAWLHKDADYGLAGVDASFYALNFPEHRLTAAVIAPLGAGWELRVDNEARLQEENPLRLTGGDDALLTALSVHWDVPFARGLRLSVQVDNLWDDDFQEVPAVPAAGRQVSFGAAYRW